MKTMKRIMFVLLCLGLLAFMVGCGDGGPRTTSNVKGVSDVLAEGMAAADGETVDAEETDAAVEEETEPVKPDVTATEGVDVDLTVLTGNMVYSEVFNMMSNSDDYEGKIVKMVGRYTHYRDENAGKDYFNCIIQDAQACCSNGIEFALTDDYVYPDDYPKEGSVIQVVGSFHTYREGEYKYYTLINATLVN